MIKGGSLQAMAGMCIVHRALARNWGRFLGRYLNALIDRVWYRRQHGTICPCSHVLNPPLLPLPLLLPAGAVVCSAW